MEVIHAKESDSFVAIGGEQAARFSVAASAAAFRIMSDTLYRDKERAAAREIICNAIDAHIDAGIPEQPIEVTLTDDELVVQDQGLGIPHDKIGPIYCTLFGSTKAQDKRATGGFGLGCKAPFSISDHFTVTSCNGGTKSLYAMVASDPEEEGCPSAKRMMKTGTMESGLTVSVPLRPGQSDKIKNHIHSIAREGGMAVRLNGELIKTPDFRDLREHGYGLIAGVPAKYGEENKIRVLYANVLYPLDAHPELDRYVEDLTSLRAGQQVWIFYAQPSTIGITPSREALSYDEETVAVLKGMLKKASREVVAAYRKAVPAVLDECLSKVKRTEIMDWRNATQIPQARNGNIVGADELGRAIAISHAWGGKFSKRQVARAAMRRFKDHGRSLRLVASNTYSVHSRNGYQARVIDSLDADRMDYIMRRVARAVGSEGAGAFYRRDNISGKVVSPTKPQAYRYRARDYALTLHIGPNTTSLNASAHWGYFLSTLKLTEAAVATIRKRCKKLGIAIVEIPKVETVKREKKPKAPEMFGPECPPLIHTFASVGHSCRRDFGTGRGRYNSGTLRVKHLDSVRYMMADAVYTAHGTTDANIPSFVDHYQTHSDILVRLVKKHVGKVAVVTQREGLANPLVAGKPRVERVILDKLKARVKRRKPYESFYARLALFALDMLPLPGRDNSFARSLARVDREHAHVALRERYSANEDRDEAYELWMCAALLFQDRYHERAHMDVEEAKLMLGLFAEYRALAQPVEVNRFGEDLPWKRTEHLSLIGSAFSHRDFSHFKGEAREDFLHIIQELGRRHDARKQKENAK